MLTQSWPFLTLAADLLLKAGLIIFILLRRSNRRASSLAWIVIILAVPLLGIIGYVLLGEARLGRRRIRRHRAIQARLLRTPDPGMLEAIADFQNLDEDSRALASLAETAARAMPRRGNRLTLIGDTAEYVESLVADIARAQRHCHLLYYIFLDDGSGRRVAEALIAAAKRGVSCRLLVDAVGSKDHLRGTFVAAMRDAGVQVVGALPANALRMIFSRLDLRNHRKIAIIDGLVGYTGSQNLADAAFSLKPKYAPWVDASVRVEGPAVVDLQQLFVVDWFLDTNESLEEALDIVPQPHPDGSIVQVLGTGPNAHHEAMRHVVLYALHTAREEVVVTTPYFVPDEATLIAMCSAAQRGVRTVLIVPGRNDSPLVAAASRSYYGELLDAGVEIHEYQAGLLHAKTITQDRRIALISSANLDRRSFELNFEISVIVYDTDFASQLRFLQTSYLDNSTSVEPLAWNRRPLPVRLGQNAIGLMSPVL